MRISTLQAQQSALSSILEQQARLSKTQLQVASGKRVLTPADDPIAATAILDVSQALAVVGQQQSNAQAAQSRLELEEGTLAGMTNALQRVHALAVQAGNGALNNNDRQSIAQEITQTLEQLLSSANTTDSNGEYLFSGYQSKVRPFDKNSSGTFDYNGDDGQRLLQVGASLSVPVSDSGTEVFRAIRNGNGTFRTQEGGNLGGGANQGSAVVDPGSASGTFVPDTYTLAFSQVTGSSPAGYTYTVTNSASAVIAGPSAYQSGAAIDLNSIGVKTLISGTPVDGDRFVISPSANQDVFQTVQNFLTTLNNGVGTGTTQAAYTNALSRVLVDLDRGMESIDNTRAKIGARLNTLDQQVDINESINVQLQETLSSLQDVDFAEAVSRLNLQLTGLQAAQQSFVKIQGLSLFNFLR